MVKLLEQTDLRKEFHVRFSKILRKSSSVNPCSRGPHALEGQARKLRFNSWRVKMYSCLSLLDFFKFIKRPVSENAPKKMSKSAPPKIGWQLAPPK